MSTKALFHLDPDPEADVIQARRLIERAGITHPPVDVARLAHIVGVSQIELADLESVDACLIQRRGGHIVLVNGNASLGRQRFSIAHEIAHVLLKSTGTNFRKRKGAGRSSKEARLCNKLAAELLMPLHLFRRHMRECEPSLDWIIELSKTFDAAVEATAWRFAEVTPDQLEIICWENHEDRILPKWIIGTEIASSWCAPQDLVFPSNDQVFGPARAFESERLVVSYERPNPNQRSALRFESRRFRWREPHYVLSIVTGASNTEEGTMT